jgi:two-component system response regulator ChvI
MFRESLTQNLKDDGYAVTDFGEGQPALEYLRAGNPADLVVLDWRMPGMTGIQLLRAIREHEIDVPVIFLTVLGDQIYEEAALHHGAVDFVEKSRSLSILKKRIELSVKRPDAASAAGERAAEEGGVIETIGHLELNRETSRAYWKGEEVPLTLNEFRIVDLLAGRPGRDVRYRELYDQVHGAGFIAGSGEEGFRGNVRTLIKRIRQKFRDLDDEFEAIENYPGFGYRWRDDKART